MLTRVPPSTVIHGVKDRLYIERNHLETWCGRNPRPGTLPLLDGDVADINCTTCLRTKRYKAAMR